MGNLLTILTNLLTILTNLAKIHPIILGPFKDPFQNLSISVYTNMEILSVTLKIVDLKTMNIYVKVDMCSFHLTHPPKIETC